LERLEQEKSSVERELNERVDRQKKDTFREIDEFKQKLLNSENLANDLQRKVY